MGRNHLVWTPFEAIASHLPKKENIFFIKSGNPGQDTQNEDNGTREQTRETTERDDVICVGKCEQDGEQGIRQKWLLKMSGRHGLWLRR